VCVCDSHQCVRPEFLIWAGEATSTIWTLPLTVIKWENFDWKFCVAALRAYGLERFFGWWQVCSVRYRNKRKERSL